ncbi:DUF5082 family protein [Halalkalibacter sp. APA_J-10(15)]|uniref:YwqH-like family protein n=1 Tax=Halalkalibacter sp. APA_J-10(15) TaxID=2933805 RepID=UPI001FF6A257|nr:DUF5082 family protein [Halalkalibacter sp. APA_J-10(15)]MCK0473461.1 DUF5082 domain-containing protein [Halalkalibacter sp. APA_J-10(15)]
MSYLHTLQSKRNRVSNQMYTKQQQHSVASDEVSRLTTALSNLQAEVSDLRSSKSRIDKLSIQTSRWKGKNESTFSSRYSSYQSVVGTYANRADDAKERVADDLRRAEERKNSLASDITNLQWSLNSLDNQIRWERVAQQKG